MDTRQHDGPTMKGSGLIVLLGITLLLGVSACQNRPFLTESIYEDQWLFVRLAVDHTVGEGHSHPASIATKDMSAFLSGMIIEKPREQLAKPTGST